MTTIKQNAFPRGNLSVQRDGQGAHKGLPVSGVCLKCLVLWNLVENWFPEVKKDGLPKPQCFRILPEILPHILVKGKVVHLVHDDATVRY